MAKTTPPGWYIGVIPLDNQKTVAAIKAVPCSGALLEQRPHRVSRREAATRTLQGSQELPAADNTVHWRAWGDPGRATSVLFMGNLNTSSTPATTSTVSARVSTDLLSLDCCRELAYN